MYEKALLPQCYFILNLHLSDEVVPNDIQSHLFEIEQSTIVSLSVLDDVFVGARNYPRRRHLAAASCC